VKLKQDLHFGMKDSMEMCGRMQTLYMHYQVIESLANGTVSALEGNSNATTKRSLTLRGNQEKEDGENHKSAKQCIVKQLQLTVLIKNGSAAINPRLTSPRPARSRIS
jgi:hypothetical protein